MSRQREVALAAVVLASIVLLLAACLGTLGSSATVSEGDFGDEWPLTVPKADLYCESPGDGDLKVAWVKAGGNLYPLTGFTETWLTKFRPGATIRDLEGIWRDDPALPGLKISIGLLTDSAFELCDSG